MCFYAFSIIFYAFSIRWYAVLCVLFVKKLDVWKSMFFVVPPSCLRRFGPPPKKGFVFCWRLQPLVFFKQPRNGGLPLVGARVYPERDILTRPTLGTGGGWLGRFRRRRRRRRGGEGSYEEILENTYYSCLGTPPQIQKTPFGGGSEAPQAARRDRKAWIFKKTPCWGVPKRRRQLGGTKKLGFPKIFVFDEQNT